MNRTIIPKKYLCKYDFILEVVFIVDLMTKILFYFRL